MAADSPLRATLLTMLGRRPTPAQRRTIATELRQLADEQEQIAAAEQRQLARPGAERATPRKRQAGPGRAPSMFVRIVYEPWGKDGRDRLRIYVGRGLWYALGSPLRLDVQRLAGRIELRPATGDAGYAVMVGKAMPRFFADGARDLLGDLMDGRYAGEVRGGAIVVGEPME